MFSPKRQVCLQVRSSGYPYLNLGAHAEMQIPRPHARPMEPGPLTVGPGNLHSLQVPQGCLFVCSFVLAAAHGLWDLSSAPGPSAVKARSPNHWTTREFLPTQEFLMDICIQHSFLCVGAVYMACSVLKIHGAVCF